MQLFQIRKMDGSKSTGIIIKIIVIIILNKNILLRIINFHQL